MISLPWSKALIEANIPRSTLYRHVAAGRPTHNDSNQERCGEKPTSSLFQESISLTPRNRLAEALNTSQVSDTSRHLTRLKIRPKALADFNTRAHEY